MFIFRDKTAFERTDDGSFKNSNRGRECNCVIAATHLNMSWQREQNSSKTKVRQNLTSPVEGMPYFDRLRVKDDDGFFSVPFIFDERTKSGHSSSA